MPEIVLAKTPGGALVPIDQDGVDYLAKLKVGQGVRVTVVRQRNLKFHRKFFALLNYAFEHWEPVESTYKGQIVAKNFDQFRNDITILAGHYTSSITLKGDVRLTAKSIAFERMDEDTFSELYSSVINVILSRILTKYSREDLDEVVERILGYA